MLKKKVLLSTILSIALLFSMFTPFISWAEPPIPPPILTDPNIQGIQKSVTPVDGKVNEWDVTVSLTQDDIIKYFADNTNIAVRFGVPNYRNAKTANDLGKAKEGVKNFITKALSMQEGNQVSLRDFHGAVKRYRAAVPPVDPIPGRPEKGHWEGTGRYETKTYEKNVTHGPVSHTAQNMDMGAMPAQHCTSNKYLYIGCSPGHTSIDVPPSDVLGPGDGEIKWTKCTKVSDAGCKMMKNVNNHGDQERCVCTCVFSTTCWGTKTVTEQVEIKKYVVDDPGTPDIPGRPGKPEVPATRMYNEMNMASNAQADTSSSVSLGVTSNASDFINALGNIRTPATDGTAYASSGAVAVSSDLNTKNHEVIVLWPDSNFNLNQGHFIGRAVSIIDIANAESRGHDNAREVAEATGGVYMLVTSLDEIDLILQENLPKILLNNENFVIIDKLSPDVEMVSPIPETNNGLAVYDSDEHIIAWTLDNVKTTSLFTLSYRVRAKSDAIQEVSNNENDKNDIDISTGVDTKVDNTDKIILQSNPKGNPFYIGLSNKGEEPHDIKVKFIKPDLTESEYDIVHNDRITWDDISQTGNYKFEIIQFDGKSPLKYDIIFKDPSGTHLPEGFAVTPTTKPIEFIVDIKSKELPNPIKITKTAEPLNAKVGDLITYTLVIENIGVLPLENVTFNDAMLGLENVLIANRIEAGESVTYVIDTPYTVTIHDAGQTLFNKVTVTAEDTDGDVYENTNDKDDNGLPDDDSGNNVVEIDEKGPSSKLIEVIKIPNIKENVRVGEEITYTLQVTNKATFVLKSIRVSDEMLGLEDFVIADKLDPGEQIEVVLPNTYTVQQEDLEKGKIVNIATVTGTDESGEDHSTTNDGSDSEATIDPNSGAKTSDNIELKKTACCETAEPGQEIYFTFEVTNIGKVPLMNIILNDEMLGIKDLKIKDVLAPGESYMYRHETPFIVPSGVTSITNIAAIKGTDDYDNEHVAQNPGTDSKVIVKDDSGKTGDNDDDGSNIPVDPKSKIQIKKEPNKDTIKRGDKIYYSFTFKNTSNEILTDIRLTDEKLGIYNILIKDTLVPGEITTYRHDKPYYPTATEVLEGVITNIATVAAKDKDGNEVSIKNKENDSKVTVKDNHEDKPNDDKNTKDYWWEPGQVKDTPNTQWNYSKPVDNTLKKPNVNQSNLLSQKPEPVIVSIKATLPDTINRPNILNVKAKDITGTEVDINLFASDGYRTTVYLDPSQSYTFTPQDIKGYVKYVSGSLKTGIIIEYKEDGSLTRLTPLPATGDKTTTTSVIAFIALVGALILAFAIVPRLGKKKN